MNQALRDIVREQPPHPQFDDRLTARLDDEGDAAVQGANDQGAHAASSAGEKTAKLFSAP
ncbi:MAG: hypothetical protein L6284_05330 [Brevundimonas sp.]|nr:hypothetical protein [Brevundimonas sp.]